MPEHTPEFTQPQLPFDEVHYITLAKHAKDITGQRFGRLVALGPVGRTKSGNIMWLCRCECGKTSAVYGPSLRSKHTVSCGCLIPERQAALHTTHGLSSIKLYGVWNQMKNRCTLITYKTYKYYGGRGIIICDEWRHDFQAFYDFVTQLPHYGENGYSIDRIDNDGNYSPGNVRWATRLEQRHNRR